MLAKCLSKSISQLIWNNLNFLSSVTVRSISQRCYSTKFDGLKSILKREIVHEEENYKMVNAEELNKFFAESKFQFSEREDSPRMELRKTDEKYTMIINFAAHPPFSQEGNRTDQQNGQDKLPEGLTEFTVRLIKNNEKSGLLVSATALDNSFQIQEVQYCDDVEKIFNQFHLNDRSANPDVYIGPDFSTLDDRLQAELRNYLTELGINEELMSFINVMALDKDQKLYQKWLKDLDNFIEH